MGSWCGMARSGRHAQRLVDEHPARVVVAGYDVPDGSARVRNLLQLWERLLPGGVLHHRLPPHWEGGGGRKADIARVLLPALVSHPVLPAVVHVHTERCRRTMVANQLVVTTAADEHTDVRVNECVIVNLPTAHLIVEVDCLH